MFALVSCGPPAPTPAVPTRPSAAQSSQLPACAKADTTAQLPEKFPRTLPLPPNTIITAVDDMGTGRISIKGIVPSDLRTAAAFFQSALPAAGYQLGRGDAEMDEAEAPFEGNGIAGKWRVNGILNCSSAVTLTLFVQPNISY